MGVNFRNKFIIVCSAVVLTVCAIGGIFALQLANSRVLSGEGTEESPYLISSRADWEAFAYNVRHGFEENDYFADTYFLLTKDIDFKNRSVPAIDGFKGVFDGGGNKLKNIKKGRVISGGDNGIGFV